MKDKTRRLLKNIEKPAGVVLGIRSVTGLSIIRSLGKHNITVIGIDSNKCVIGAFSKYCSSMEIFVTEKDLLSLLIEIGRLSRFKNIIFCESDKMVLFIDQYQEYLKQYYHLCIPSEIATREIINKKSMVMLAQESGIKTPATFFYPETSFEEIKNNITYPVIVKPYFTQAHYRAKGVVINDETALQGDLTSVRFLNGCIVQEIIRGREQDLWTCIGYCDKNSVPVVLFTGHKLRQKPRDFGVATLAVSKQNERIKELARTFLKHIRYAGCFELEFKKSEDKEEYVFIEINPRICSLNEMAITSGFNIAFIAYCDINGIPLEVIPCQKDNVVWVDITNDLDSCLRYYFKDNKYVLLDWVKRVMKSDAYAVLDLHDIKPFIYDFGKYFLKSLLRMLWILKPKQN